MVKNSEVMPNEDFWDKAIPVINEDTLIEDNRTLEEVIRDVAEQEGMSYEETLKLFKKGYREANNFTEIKVDHKKKAKAKKKKKVAKASKKRNR
jgi:hypothetical protein